MSFVFVVAIFGILLLSIYRVLSNATLFHMITKLERKLAGLSLHRVRIEELDIEYLRGGRGPVLVFLHGFGADKDNWNRIASKLSKRFDVVSLDLPGFGNSSSDLKLDYDVYSQVLRVKKFVDALGVDSFHLAGSSMGGYIAGNFAAQFPSRVQNLWLISPFGIVDSQTSEMFLDVKAGQNPVVLPRNEAEFYTLFRFLFVNPPFIPNAIVKHLALEAKARVAINTKIFEQIHRMTNQVPNPDSPLEKVLANYKGLVLVSWGEQDRVLHASGAKTLDKVIVHTTIDVMPNIGHLPMIENSRKSAESFIAFCR